MALCPPVCEQAQALLEASQSISPALPPSHPLPSLPHGFCLLPCSFSPFSCSWHVLWAAPLRPPPPPLPLQSPQPPPPAPGAAGLCVDFGDAVAPFLRCWCCCCCCCCCSLGEGVGAAGRRGEPGPPPRGQPSWRPRGVLWAPPGSRTGAEHAAAPEVGRGSDPEGSASAEGGDGY